MGLPLYYFTLINVTTTELPQTERNRAIPVDFSNVFISGVEDPKTELKSPMLLLGVPSIGRVKVEESRNLLKRRQRIFPEREKKVDEREEWNLDPRQEVLARTLWSDCGDLDKGASFHPLIVVGVNWVPVYAWSLDGVDNFVHQFLVPTVKLVEYYKKTFGPYVNSEIDWSEPKMLLSLLITEKLLIAEGRRGKFKAIEKFEMPDSVPPDFSIPVTTFQFKVKGAYLAMMCCDCDHPYTVVLGDVHSAPRSRQEMIAAGQSFGIIGWGAPVIYDAYEEQSVRRAMQNHRAELLAKKNSVIKGDFPYDETRSIKDTVLSAGIHLGIEE